jgi:hypothetical protein
VRTATFGLLVCVFSNFGSVFSAAAADDCERNDAILIESLPGFEPKGQPDSVAFNYESREEKFSSTAHRYIWCIENKDAVPAQFLWGNKSVENLYFASVVTPNQMKPTIRTDTSGSDRDLRILKNQALSPNPNTPIPSNTTNWHTINPRTIYFRSIGQNLWAVPIQKVQLSSVDPRMSKYSDYMGSSNLIDIIRLSQDQKLFRDFVYDQQKIHFYFSSTATVPTSREVLNAIEEGKYEKYSPQDFINWRITIMNFITLDGGGNPTETITLSASPDSPADEKGLTAASDLPISLELSPGQGRDASNFPSGLRFATNISNVSKTLLARPIPSLVNADMLITVRSKRFTFHSMPFVTVVPVDQK